MYNKFLAAIFVSIFGMNVSSCVSFAAAAMVHEGLSEEFSEDKLSTRKSTAGVVPDLTELPRNDGSAYLSELTYKPKKTVRNVSEDEIGYVDIESEEKESLSNEMKELVLASMEAFIDSHKGQASCIYLSLFSSLGSPKSPINRKRIDSKEEVARSTPNIFTMIIQLPVGLPNNGR
ncbi:MAG: hypothetical protein NWS47_01355 [Alphaproteobacteria bacterium]|jgi:hypothetical protein|nr:hypothetical protein [Alphaproteobacteria bacterium]